MTTSSDPTKVIPWNNIRPILDGAFELDFSERVAFVEGACDDPKLKRQVLSVIAVYESETEGMVRPRFVSAVPIEEAYPPGSKIGPYQIEKRLGAGGMGAVYLARRSDESYDQWVAVKLIKKMWASEREVGRFRRERQILADLRHPSIAQLLDGGETPEGHPYLVMEYVDGLPIDVYCREHQLGLDRRLDLFEQVCSAVQFAHRNLIVHRDLKPSNILVANDGKVKLLDFGIAKVLDTSDFAITVLETKPGNSPMTLAYASPEQVKGEPVTTATDVYSLGILLYEILSGRRPYRFDQKNLIAAVSMICDREVIAPSVTIRRDHESEPSSPPAVHWKSVRGDLDAITMLALAKEPDHRYASAEQMATDLKRYRGHRPIHARRATLTYRARKYFYRNRLSLTALVAVFAVLLISIQILTAQQERLLAERNFAEVEHSRAQTVSDWMVELFELPDPGRSLGEQVTARELLDKSSLSVKENLADEPELQRLMYKVLAETYFNLGLGMEARAAAQSALRVSRRLPADRTTVEILSDFSEILNRLGKGPQAMKVSAEAVTRAGEILDETDPLFARALTNRARSEEFTEQFAGAEASYARALESARVAQDDEVSAYVLGRYAGFALLQERRDLADRLLREAIELERSLKGPRHPNVAELEMHLSFAESERKQLSEAIESVERAIEQQREFYPDGHFLLVDSLDRLARFLQQAGRFEESERTFQEALSMSFSVLGESHSMTARVLFNLGSFRIQQGRYAEARSLILDAQRTFELEQGPTSISFAACINKLGTISFYEKDLDGALDQHLEAYDLLEQVAGLSYSKTLSTMSNIGTILMNQGKLEEARSWFRKAVVAAKDKPEPAKELPLYLYYLAIAENRLGADPALIIPFFKEAAEIEGADSLLGRECQTWYGRNLLRVGRAVEAEQELSKAQEWWQGAGDSPLSELFALRFRALAIMEQGRLLEAGDLFETRWQRLQPIEERASRLEQAQDDLAKIRRLIEEQASDPQEEGGRS